MGEKDLHTLQLEFRGFVGFMATAEVTEDGAMRAARIIVELDDKVREKKTHSTDLFRAAIAASQLIERWSQLRQHLAAGSITSDTDEETLTGVQEKFSAGNLPKKEIMRLITVAYVASPSLAEITLWKFCLNCRFSTPIFLSSSHTNKQFYPQTMNKF